MKVCVTGDFHGRGLPEIPDCDLLLLHGDLGIHLGTTRSVEGIDRALDPLRAWLTRSAETGTTTVAVAGNHDNDISWMELLHAEGHWMFLHDDWDIAAGYKVWGSPWSVEFNNWAWMESDADLAEKYKQIPDDVDIIVSHTPPYGYRDYSMYGNEHAGSQALRDRALQLTRLRLIACGHIHEGYGVTFIPDSNTLNKHAVIVANGSYVDGAYHPGNPPIILDL